MSEVCIHAENLAGERAMIAFPDIDGRDWYECMSAWSPEVCRTLDTGYRMFDEPAVDDERYPEESRTIRDPEKAAKWLMKGFRRSIGLECEERMLPVKVEMMIAGEERREFERICDGGAGELTVRSDGLEVTIRRRKRWISKDLSSSCW